MKSIKAVLTLASLLALAGTLAASPSPQSVSVRGESVRMAQQEQVRSAARLEELLKEYAVKPSADLASRIDAEAGQKNAVYSRLFWHTDLPSAMAEAKAGNKPILYLRMLGNLTDEFSCANSRFFRTALYANQSVSSLLREKYVLVWVSERAVPMVTIDFGDGRVMQRTITGNSAHYVLDAQGNVIDALPGLFDAATFRTILESAAVAAAGDEAARKQHLASAVASLTAMYEAKAPELAAADRVTPTDATGKIALSGDPANAPDARPVMERTMSKRIVEEPMLSIMPPETNAREEAAKAAMRTAAWDRIARENFAGAALDSSSTALMRAQNPALGRSALRQLIASFQLSLAADNARNNLDFRRRVLSWMRDAQTPYTVESLNKKVYSELFMTPREDSWLGLKPANAYSGLMNDGIEQASRK